MTNQAAADLIARSNRLGADPKNTNYAGGNTSAKGTETDPVTGRAGRADVGEGLGRRPRHAHRAGTRGAAARPPARARRRLPRRRPRGRDGRRVRLLPARQGRRGPVDRHGDARPRRRGARRPPAPRLRHRDRDRRRRRGAHARRSSATRSCGCRGGARASSSASTSPRSRRANPQAIGCILGGHGITAWGDTSEESEQNSLWIIDTAAAYIAEHGAAEPFGAVVPGYEPLAPSRAPRQGRRARRRRSAGSRRTTGRWSATSPTTRRGARVPLARRSSPRLAALGTSCPDHFLRTKVKPLRARPARRRPDRGLDRPPEGAARAVPRRLPGVLRRATRRPRRPAIRGADPLIVLVPASACSASARTSRPRAWRASSTSTRST